MKNLAYRTDFFHLISQSSLNCLYFLEIIPTADSKIDYDSVIEPFSIIIADCTSFFEISSRDLKNYLRCD